MNEKEFKAVIRIPNEKRLKYFISKVGDSEFIYSLADKNDGLEIFNVEGRNYIPIWSDYSFVDHYKKIIGNLDDLKIIKISIYDIDDIYGEAFNKHNVEFFDIFPVNELTANIMKIDSFYSLLNEELNKYP